MKMWAIMRRDLLKLSRNPLTLLSTILMPIVYLVIIGNSFNGNSSICRSRWWSKITASTAAEWWRNFRRSRPARRPSTFRM